MAISNIKFWLAIILVLCCGCRDLRSETPPTTTDQKPPAENTSDWDSKIGSVEIGSHSDRIGAASIETLAMGGPSTSPKIAEFILDPSPTVKQRAVDVLAGFGSEAEPALFNLANFLKDPNPEIRAATAQAMARIGLPKALPYLQKASKDPQTEVALWGHAGLASLNEDCEDHFEEAIDILLKAQNRDLARKTTQAIRLMPCLHLDSVPRLIKSFWGQEEDIQVAAIQVLGIFGPKAGEAVPELIKLLDNPSWRLRQSALLALARMQEKSLPALPNLLKLLRDPSPRFRELAAYVLGEIGPSASEAEEELRKACLDQEATVQAAAKRALLRVVKEP